MLSQHGGYELDRFVVDFIGLSYGENNRSRRHRGEQLVDNIRGHVSGAVLGSIPPERGLEGPTKPGYPIDGGHVQDHFPLTVPRTQINPSEHESAWPAADPVLTRALIARRTHRHPRAGTV